MTLRNLSESQPFFVIKHAFSKLLLFTGRTKIRKGEQVQQKKGEIKGLERDVSVTGRMASP